MRPRVLAALWLILGIALWNGVFDLYIGRGVREYLQLRAESELGLGPEPEMAAVMARSHRVGAWAASIWSVLVVGSGWATIALVRRGTLRDVGRTQTATDSKADPRG